MELPHFFRHLLPEEELAELRSAAEDLEDNSALLAYLLDKHLVLLLDWADPDESNSLSEFLLCRAKALGVEGPVLHQGEAAAEYLAGESPKRGGVLPAMLERLQQDLEPHALSVVLVDQGGDAYFIACTTSQGADALSGISDSFWDFQPVGPGRKGEKITYVVTCPFCCGEQIFGWGEGLPEYGVAFPCRWCGGDIHSEPQFRVSHQLTAVKKQYSQDVLAERRMPPGTQLSDKHLQAALAGYRKKASPKTRLEMERALTQLQEQKDPRLAALCRAIVDGIAPDKYDYVTLFAWEQVGKEAAQGDDEAMDLLVDYLLAWEDGLTAQVPDDKRPMAMRMYSLANTYTNA